MPEKVPSNHLSVYLIKEEYSEPTNIFKSFNNLQKRHIDGVGNFYFGKSHTMPPSWLNKFFGTQLNDITELFNASSRGVLLVSVKVAKNHKRLFAVPFGYGWTFLNNGVYEERFGLRATLNIIDPTKLRHIDKKSMTFVPKDTSEQLSIAGVAADFGIDIEQDLIRSVTGATRDDVFGKTVTGKDALNVSVKIDVSNIHDFLKVCYERYASNDYKEDFGWIDQISEIKDPRKVEDLDARLIENIKAKEFEKTWMAVPEIVTWSDVEGFAYRTARDTERRDDIDLADFLDSLSDEQREALDVAFLRQKQAYCFRASNGQLLNKWSIYSCLYCEIANDNDGKTHLLSNGKWYEIDTNFAGQVHSDYQTLLDKGCGLKLPAYKHQNEDEYNEDVAKHNEALSCMHGKNIMHGGSRSRIEFCDLYGTDGRMIHVKRYGQSSVLSHLFMQGVVSGELLLSDSDFRGKLNKKLPSTHKIKDAEKKPDPAKHEVVFAVISTASKPLDIPFFSKVSFRNAKRRLEAYGYKVSLLKVAKEE